MLDIIPANEAHRAEYIADFQAMAEALRAVQGCFLLGGSEIARLASP